MSRKRSRYKKVCIAAAAVGAASPLFGQTVSSWTAPVSGSWTDASHWSAGVTNNGTPPGATYDAVIDAGGAAYTVGLASDVALHSFTLNSADATLAQSGGTFDAGAVTLQAGTYVATGGTLRASSITGAAGAAINVGGAFTLDPGALGVNVLATAGSALTLTGSWSNSGLVSVTGGTLTLAGTPTAVGPIALTNSTLAVATYLTTPQVTSATFNNSAVSVGLGGTVDNTGQTILLSPGGPAWTLAGGQIGGGTISATGGTKLGVAAGTVSLLAGLNLAADVDVPATSTLILNSLASNSGTVKVNGGTLRLGGLVNTTSLGTVHNNGGTVVISGVVNNTGTLAFDASTGSWQLAPSGAIGGGTITGTAPNNLVALGGTLTGVTVAGEVTVGDGVATNVALTTSNVSLATGARLTLNAPAGASSVGVLPSGTQPTLNGAAEIVFDGAGDGGYVRPASTGQALTFGPSLTVRTGVRGGTVGGAGSSLVNRGLLSAQTAGRTLSVQGTFSNQGTVEARNGGTVSLAAAPTNLSGGTMTGGTWNVFDGATIALPAGSSVTTNAAAVTLSGAGSTFAAMNALASNTGTLSIAGGKVFTTAGNLANSGAVSVGTGSTLKVVGTLTNSGSVDLAGGTLVLDYAGASPADSLRAQLATGRAGGSWSGATGVKSSTAAADAQHRVGVGYAEASALGVSNWAGVGVDSTAVVTKVTWYGDANLDGRVNADDYALLDRGYAKHLAGWVNGDFDYSGAIDAADYLLVDRVFVQQGGTLSPAVLAQREAEFGTAYAAQLLVAVPEPSAVMLVAAGVPMVLRRRRR